MKRIVSTLLGMVMMFTLSITAFAEEINRTAIKNRLFEYIWKEELADEEEFQPAEQSPVVAFAYGQVCEFIDSLTDREISRYNISDPETTREYTIRQVRKGQFSDWCEEKYDHWFVDYDDDNNVWIMETKEYGDLTFKDDQAEWRLFDKDNNVVKTYSKPLNLDFLKSDLNSKEVVEDDDFDDTTNLSEKEEKNSETVMQDKAVEQDSSRTDSESKAKKATEKEESSNTKIYIILTIVVVTAGVCIIIYYNKRKDNKK